MDQGPQSKRGKMELLDLYDDDLLHILSFLDSEDVFTVSKICTQFQKLCLYTKLVWRSLTLNLGQEKDSRNRVLKLTENQKKILEISGDTPQKVQISIDYATADEFDNSDLLTLEKKSKSWNLKTFSFEVLPVHVELHYISESLLVFSKAIIRLFKGIIQSPTNAGLERLSLSAHSLGFATDEFWGILVDMPPSLSIYKSVKSLALDSSFFFNQSILFPTRLLYAHHVWALEMNYCEAIERFKNLQMLEINSVYLSDFLLEALSQPDRVSLQNLTIVINDGTTINEGLPWEQLVESSPSLKVMVESLHDINWRYAYEALPVCVPIVSWKIYSLSQVKSFNRKKLKEAFKYVCLYKQTLQCVAIQIGSEMLCHFDLMRMITRCSKVQTLYLQGRIRLTTILELASLQRQWIKLGVWESDLMFPVSWKESRDKRVARLCKEVSEKLGCKWQPELEVVLKTVFNHTVINPLKKDDGPKCDIL